jgi:hypothetical protein
MKVGSADGLDDLNLAGIVGRSSNIIHCAVDLDSFLLIGDLAGKNYDILHISGCAVCGVFGRPRMQLRSNPSQLVELKMAKIGEVLDATCVTPRLIILDSPPLAEKDGQYKEFLESHRIGAILYYSNCQPSHADRRHFLPRFLGAVLDGRTYTTAIQLARIMEEGSLDLQPKIETNKKLLKCPEDKVSLFYPD